MKRSLKIILFMPVFVMMTLFYTVSVYAAEETPDDFGLSGIFDNLPPQVKAELPDIINNNDAGLDIEKINEQAGFSYIFDKLLSALKAALLPAAKTFSSLLGILLISSAMGVFSRDISGGKLSPLLSLVSCLTICLTAFVTQSGIEVEVSLFVGSLTAFSAALIPVLGGIMLTSTNALGAGVAVSGLLIFTTALQYVCTYIFIPLYRVCLGLSIISATCGAASGSLRLCELIKKVFTVTATCAAVVFTAVLTYQAQLAAVADSVAARSVKFTVSSAIPVVGGALGDAVRVAASGLSVIKSEAGIAGLLVIILLAAPVVCHLLCNSAVLGIAASAAKMLGCEREAALFSELRSISGFALAVTSLSCILFIITVAVIIKMNPAAAL